MTEQNQTVSTEGELISEKAILRLMNHIKAEASGGSYTLPAASDSTLGGIKVGQNLTIEADGTLNAQAGGSGELSLAPLPLGSDHQNILLIDILADSEEDEGYTLTTVDLKSDSTWDIFKSVVTLGIREYNSEGTSPPAHIGSSPWISTTWYNHNFTWSPSAPHAPTISIPNCLRFVGMLDNYIISLDQSGSSMQIRTESGQARRIYVYMIKH